MSKDLQKQSKFLSLVLRHDPGSIGIELDPQGWVDVEALIAKSPVPLTRADLIEIVTTSDKQRFALSADGSKIRANQGHSVEIDLQLAPKAPPDRLFHGTATRSLDAILAEGLSRQSRHHVHLSADVETATTVGKRHGKPVVLVVEAGRMAAEGHRFWQSENGVWLADAVPPQFLSLMAS
ncbi:MAG: RNA 2'-phosphotransferase [Paracoccaceae bacterium]